MTRSLGSPENVRRCFFALLCLLAQPPSTSAEVTRVTVTSRTTVADGQSFGSTGAYEWLVGRIDFALDPADPHNVGTSTLIARPSGPPNLHSASPFVSKNYAWNCWRADAVSRRIRLAPLPDSRAMRAPVLVVRSAPHSHLG